MALFRPSNAAFENKIHSLEDYIYHVSIKQEVRAILLFMLFRVGWKSLRLLRRQSWWLDAATPGPASVARRMGSNNRQLSESHILEFVEAFNKFDETQSGLVSTKQLGNLLRHLGINPTKEELQVKGGIKIKTVKFLLFCTVVSKSFNYLYCAFSNPIKILLFQLENWRFESF